MRGNTDDPDRLADAIVPQTIDLGPDLSNWEAMPELKTIILPPPPPVSVTPITPDSTNLALYGDRLGKGTITSSNPAPYTDAPAGMVAPAVQLGDAPAGTLMTRPDGTPRSTQELEQLTSDALPNIQVEAEAAEAGLMSPEGPAYVEPSFNFTSHPSLSEEGEDRIRLLQLAIRSPVDGDFGPASKEALESYQTANGLTVTGDPNDQETLDFISDNTFRSATLDGGLTVTELYRQQKPPTTASPNISLDYNSTAGASGTMVVVPWSMRDNTQVVEAAVNFNNLMASFAEKHGIDDYRIHSSNGRGKYNVPGIGWSSAPTAQRSKPQGGIRNTLHPEPFFIQDAEMLKAVEENFDEFSSIYEQAYGNLSEFTMVMPHGDKANSWSRPGATARGAGITDRIGDEIFDSEIAFGAAVARNLVERNRGEPSNLKPEDDATKQTNRDKQLLMGPQAGLGGSGSSEESAFDFNQFYSDIGVYAEDDHGSTPVPTNDASEASTPRSERSRDVGFGHKVQDSENASRTIHGIPFRNPDGSYIPLTDAQKATILQEDMRVLLNQARADTDQGIGWDTKLSNIRTSWDELGAPYQAALTSLAYNVGGSTAGREWTAVLTDARDEDLTSFAKNLRRQDNEAYTAGMDNRVMKELYYAGLISNRSEVSDQLPLASRSSGVPR